MPRASSTTSGRSISRVDTLILAAGLVAAAVSGIAAHRAVGPYGDGPLSVGLYRTTDPATGAHLVYRNVRRRDGAMLRYLFDGKTRRLREVRMTRDVDGTPVDVVLHMANGVLKGISTEGRTVEWDAKKTFVKVGFSLQGNGVIDAWEYRDAKGVLQKIEVSRRQDGVVDRWEYYKDEQLARVEEDDNRDGRVDRWLTYDAGILMEEARDRNGDGRPDARR